MATLFTESLWNGLNPIRDINRLVVNKGKAQSGKKQFIIPQKAGKWTGPKPQRQPKKLSFAQRMLKNAKQLRKDLDNKTPLQMIEPCTIKKALSVVTIRKGMKLRMSQGSKKTLAHVVLFYLDSHIRRAFEMKTLTGHKTLHEKHVVAANKNDNRCYRMPE